jgi:hypothetical protein
VAAVADVLLPPAELVPANSRTGWLVITDALGALGVVAYVVNAIPFLTSVTGQEERNHVVAVQAALWPLAGFAGKSTLPACCRGSSPGLHTCRGAMRRPTVTRS